MIPAVLPHSVRFFLSNHTFRQPVETKVMCQLLCYVKPLLCPCLSLLHFLPAKLWIKTANMSLGAILMTDKQAWILALLLIPLPANKTVSRAGEHGCMSHPSLWACTAVSVAAFLHSFAFPPEPERHAELQETDYGPLEQSPSSCPHLHARTRARVSVQRLARVERTSVLFLSVS